MTILKSIRSIFEDNTIGKHLRDSVTYTGMDIDNICAAIKKLMLTVEEIEEVIYTKASDIGGCGVGVNPEDLAQAIYEAQERKRNGLSNRTMS